GVIKAPSCSFVSLVVKNSRHHEGREGTRGKGEIMAKNGKASKQEFNWATNPRWAGVTRPYTAEDIERLRGSLRIEYTLARNGAERLWELLHGQSYLPALGAMTGNQAIQQMKAMIEAGAACVHFEDQLSSAKKCGHLGGKVLVSTGEAIQKLVAARLAADVMGVPTLIMARTDANSAHLLTSDIDPRDHEFLT